MVPDFGRDFASDYSRLSGRHESSVVGEQCRPTMSVVTVDQFDESEFKLANAREISIVAS
jgi:hypothetical protein